MNLQQIRERIEMLLEFENVSVNSYKEIQGLVNNLVQEVLQREQKLKDNDSE